MQQTNTLTRKNTSCIFLLIYVLCSQELVALFSLFGKFLTTERSEVIRILSEKFRRESCKPLFKTLGISTLPKAYILEIIIIFVKKSLFVRNGVELSLYEKSIAILCRNKVIKFSSFKYSERK